MLPLASLTVIVSPAVPVPLISGVVSSVVTGVVASAVWAFVCVITGTVGGVIGLISVTLLSMLVLALLSALPTIRLDFTLDAPIDNITVLVSLATLDPQSTVTS